MSDQSLLESVIEHDSDKLLVYGAFGLALAVGAVMGEKGDMLYLVPVFLGVAFFGLVVYYYRKTVRSD